MTSARRRAATSRQLENLPKTKAEFVKTLSDSFALCDEVFSSLTDANAAAFVKRGEGHITKTALLVGALAHGSEICSARGLVPPASR